MAIEADPSLRAPLRRLAADLGGRPIELLPGKRALYHAAAVLAGNAPLALLSVASELLVAAGLEPDIAEQGLLALLEGALANARRVGPRAALTGPVVRGDTATVARHLEALHEHPDADALYRALTREIVRLAGPEGREEISEMLNGDREGGTGLRAEARLGAGGSCNASGPQRSTSPMPPPGAEARAQPAPGPERSTSPAPPPTTEDPTCQ
jgi:hypothetical protein